jgi:hypothetical protein
MDWTWGRGVHFWSGVVPQVALDVLYQYLKVNHSKMFTEWKKVGWIWQHLQYHLVIDGKGYNVIMIPAFCPQPAALYMLGPLTIGAWIIEERGRLGMKMILVLWVSWWDIRHGKSISILIKEKTTAKIAETGERVCLKICLPFIHSPVSETSCYHVKIFTIKWYLKSNSVGRICIL